MAEPRGRPGSRGGSLGDRRPADRVEVREAQASAKVDAPIFRRSVLGPVFAHDEVEKIRLISAPGIGPT
jgi:hypothetical protein